jgi:hypothetical protein
MRLVLAFVLVIALAAIAVEASEDVPTVVAAAPPKPVKATKKAGRRQKPGAATLAAVKKLPKAPKDELIKFVGRNNRDLTGARLHTLHLYLKSQNLFTMEDLINLGTDGIKSLAGVPENVRGQFLEHLIKYIGSSRKVDDGLMVPVPEGLKKRVPPKEESNGCPKTPRFLAMPVNNAAPSPVGDWLRRAYPHIKPLHMSRTILALQRQTIRTFADLRVIAGQPPTYAGIDKLLHVPEGVREALREALIYHIGEEGHDDHKPVYVNPNPPLVPWPKHCSHGVAQYK